MNYEEMHERTENERGNRRGQAERMERDLKCYLGEKLIQILDFLLQVE